MEIVQEMLGKPAPDDFVGRYRARCRLALEANLKPVAGVEAALKELKVEYCVASSGDHDKMQTTLGITGLLPYFKDKMFSATEVAHGKPHPDVYLHAAQRMGVDAGSCLVVEDTPIGVRAGVAAGMKVLGYAALTNEGSLRDAGASLIFKDMRELPRLIATASFL
jgi:HAD superfamily hydrolase (TIGR01509 family)